MVRARFRRSSRVVLVNVEVERESDAGSAGRCTAVCACVCHVDDGGIDLVCAGRALSADGECGGGELFAVFEAASKVDDAGGGAADAAGGIFCGVAAATVRWKFADCAVVVGSGADLCDLAFDDVLAGANASPTGARLRFEGDSVLGVVELDSDDCLDGAGCDCRVAVAATVVEEGRFAVEGGREAREKIGTRKETERHGQQGERSGRFNHERHERHEKEEGKKEERTGGGFATEHTEDTERGREEKEKIGTRKDTEEHGKTRPAERMVREI